MPEKTSKNRKLPYLISIRRNSAPSPDKPRHSSLFRLPDAICIDCTAGMPHAIPVLTDRSGERRIEKLSENPIDQLSVARVVVNRGRARTGKGERL